jgi:hypothetical protein
VALTGRVSRYPPAVTTTPARPPTPEPARDLNERLPEARKGLPALVPNKGVPALRRADIEHVSNPCQDYGSEYELGLDLIRDGSKPGSRHNPGRGVANVVLRRPGADGGRMPGHGSAYDTRPRLGA